MDEERDASELDEFVNDHADHVVCFVGVGVCLECFDITLDDVSANVVTELLGEHTEQIVLGEVGFEVFDFLADGGHEGHGGEGFVDCDFHDVSPFNI